MMTNEPTRAKKIFARTCIAICVGIVAFPAIARWVKSRDSTQDGCTWSESESRQKLLKIGRALQLYREQYGFKPVAERKNLYDAGLPPSAVVLTEYGAGKVWGLEPADLRISCPNATNAGNLCHFEIWYYDMATMDTGGTDFPAMDQMFAKRGEDLPIFSDTNMMTLADRWAQGGGPVMILRLNGQVELIEHATVPRLDLLAR